MLSTSSNYDALSSHRGHGTRVRLRKHNGPPHSTGTITSTMYCGRFTALTIRHWMAGHNSWHTMSLPLILVVQSRQLMVALRQCPSVLPYSQITHGVLPVSSPIGPIRLGQNRSTRNRPLQIEPYELQQYSLSAISVPPGFDLGGGQQV
jgi:hypothetical protein